MEKWFIKNKKANFSFIAKQFGISEVLAQLIVNRNITSNKELEEYINPSLKHLYMPGLLKDIDHACDILIDKIKEKKRIRIIGDYDVDGIMSTYILYSALHKCGAIVDYEIPDRIKDGYGINISIIKEANTEGIDTIITCDNGIAAYDEIAYAKELKQTVIITDHHDIPYIEENNDKKYIIPNADAVVNPKQEQCKYPFKYLCGAAVAFKLVEVLYEKFGIPNTEKLNFLEFVAIATVCDVMDLINENRIITKTGLKALQKTNNYGLKALIQETGLSDKEINIYHIGFVIGPCLNASGRLESAKLGLKMLLSENETEAKMLAKQMKELNDERKNLTAEGLEAAIHEIEESNLKSDKVLLVYLPDCHESLAGIIAGRIKERYYKPAIVLTNAEDGVKGSGRSIEGYNMFEELSKCKDLMTKFGGHPMAAGVSLNKDKVEELRTRLNAQTTLRDEYFDVRISADMVLSLEQISIGLIQEISLLEPFGRGNVKPLFAVKDIIIHKAMVLGKNRNTLKLSVKTKNSTVSYTAMLFGKVEEFEHYIVDKYDTQELENLYNGDTKNVLMDFIYYPSINEYNGYQNIQIIVQNYR
jgi:single-stranded-DNA-specific exonuclease RecJ